MGWQAALGAAAGEIAGGLLQGGSDGIDVSENYRLNDALLDLQPKAWDMKVGGVTRAAKKYGYHPMYLMGGSSGYSPTVVAGHGKQGGPDYAGIGSRLGQAAGEYFTQGKHKQTAAEKAMGLRMQNAQVRNAELEAELKYTEIKRMQQEMNGVRHTGGNPEDGGAESHGAQPLVKKVPAEVVRSAPNEPEREAGVRPGWKRYQLANGRYVDMPAAMDPDELASPGMLQMIMRNLGWLEGIDDPKIMTQETHKLLKRLGLKPKRKRGHGQMGRRRKY